MSIPLREAWSALDPAAKRARLLRAAGEVFARDGLDTPMPRVAAAAGAGVGSVYRQFPSKRELIAALAIDRLDQIAEGARQADARAGSRWEALSEMLWRLLERQSCDDFFGAAMAVVAGHPEVVAAQDRAHAAIDELLLDTRAEGRLREDATALDLRLLFAATRAARQVEPTAWRRMLELLLDALDAGRPTGAGAHDGGRRRRAAASGTPGTRRPG